MRLVNIGNHAWAVGLSWVQYKDRRKRYAGLQKEVAATREGVPDMVTFRPRQYGFGVAGERLNSYRASNPLAGGIEILSSSFLGIFRLRDTDGEDFWWVFAIKNGLISATGEVVCSTREEVEAEVIQLRDLLGEFEENVLCEAWDERIEHDTPSSLTLLVLGDAGDASHVDKPSSLEWLEPLLTYRRSSRLQLLKNIYQRRKRRLVAGATAAICLAGGLTLASLLNSWTEQQAMRDAQRISEARQQRLANLQAHPEREFFKPWVTAMPVQDMTQRCLATMLALPVVASGWALDRVTCDGQNVQVDWRFELGSDFLALPPGAILLSPQKAASTIHLAEFIAQKQDGESLLPSRDIAARHFYQLTQSMGTLLALNFRPQEKKKVEKQEIVAPWQKGEWELTGIPEALMFDNSLALALSIPGLVMKSVEYAGEWSFKGEIYVLPR